MQIENKYLQIEGIVEKKVLNQLLGERRYSKLNTKWFFVDYSPVSYKLNTKFDFILAGEDKKLLPEIFNIKLLDVIDQTGKHLGEIPLGWKTICRFEFKGKVPTIVNELPVLSKWEYNNTIKFARHEDLVVDPFNMSKHVYADVLSDFVQIGIHTHSINTANFLDYCVRIVSDNKLEMNDRISDPDLIADIKKRELHTDL